MFFLDIVMGWLHLLGAVTWVGGLIFVNIVLTPAVAPRGVPPQFVRLMGMERFRWFAMGSIATLLVTGAYKAYRQIPSAEALFGSTYGTILLLKLAVVGLMVAVTLMNAVIIRGRLVNAAPAPGGPSVEVEHLGRRLTILSRVNLVLGLTVLALVAILGNV